MPPPRSGPPLEIAPSVLKRMSATVSRTATAAAVDIVVVRGPLFRSHGWRSFILRVTSMSLTRTALRAALQRSICPRVTASPSELSYGLAPPAWVARLGCPALDRRSRTRARAVSRLLRSSPTRSCSHGSPARRGSETWRLAHPKSLVSDASFAASIGPPAWPEGDAEPNLGPHRAVGVGSAELRRYARRGRDRRVARATRAGHADEHVPFSSCDPSRLSPGTVARSAARYSSFSPRRGLRSTCRVSARMVRGPGQALVRMTRWIAAG